MEKLSSPGPAPGRDRSEYLRALRQMLLLGVIVSKAEGSLPFTAVLPHVFRRRTAVKGRGVAAFHSRPSPEYMGNLDLDKSAGKEGCPREDG